MTLGPSIPARRDRSCDGNEPAKWWTACSSLNSRIAGYAPHTINPQFQLRWIGRARVNTNGNIFP